MRDRRLLSQFQPLVDVIEEARRQRAGPPLDPRAASYSHALLLAKGMLYQEIKRDPRRQAVLAEFDRRIERIERSVTHCRTLGDQLFGLENALKDANFFGLDLPRHRPPKGGDDASLLREYESLLPRIQRLFRQVAQCSHRVRVERLALDFPSLSAEQVAEAEYDKPSWAACVVLGARYELSPARVRDRLTAARRQRRPQKGRT